MAFPDDTDAASVATALESITDRAVQALEDLEARYIKDRPVLDLQSALEQAIRWSFREEFHGDASETFRLEGWQGAV
jgi:hypothetical protein